MTISAAIAIDPAYLEATGNPIISSNSPIEGEGFDSFAALTSAAKAHGSLILGQLNRPGRQTMAALKPEPVSASDVQLEANEMHLQFNKPHPASDSEIAEINSLLLNAAYGYMFSRFLLPRTNRRSDKYGGSLENRARLLLDVVRAVRARCGAHLVLSVKLNCIEYQPEGLTLDDAKAVCGWLEPRYRRVERRYL